MKKTELAINSLCFPFSAVTGQTQFKLALQLIAVNPAIGGLLISGSRGCAKSTLARGFADLLPACDSKDSSGANFVTLPLGASEEMLLGTLDLQQVLNDKQVLFSPGLLSKANGGVLYIDEVNLLPDNLVDLLLDVAASGINHIERDGISHRHQAKFLLIGTMNPDEGELRPQLHDRFGLAVELHEQYSLEQRIEIVENREEFDLNPEAFCYKYKAEQAALVEAIQVARKRLKQVECPAEFKLEIAKRCQVAQVDGLRADIVWYRAAIAHAVLKQNNKVEMYDIEAVEELVLSHRRNNQPPDSHSLPPKSNGFTRSDSNKSAEQSQSDWGQMPPVQQKTADSVSFAVKFAASKNRANKPTNVAGANNSGYALGKQKKTSLLSMRPDWFRTLITNMGVWPPAKLRFKHQQQGNAMLHLVLLDTSGSTLKANQFANAKAAVLEIARLAYLKREQLAIWGFGNNQVDSLLARIRAPKELRGWLDNLAAGGGTPLKQILIKTSSYIKKLKCEIPEIEVCTYVLTDGRSRAQLQQINLLGKVIWIDTEQATVKRGRGQEFAALLGADYLSLAT